MTWLRTFRHYVKASIMTDIAIPMISLMLFTLMLCLLEFYGIKVSSNNLPFVSALSLTVGLLLVFRNNTAYDRYWEGRKYWTQIHTNARTFGRVLAVNLNDTADNSEKDKENALSLLLTLCKKIKDDLRSESEITIENSLGSWLKKLKEPASLENKSQDELEPKVQKITNAPKIVLKPRDTPNTNIIEAIIQLGMFIKQQKAKGSIDNGSAGVLELMVSEISNAHLGCQRIARTPISPAYMIHLEQVLALYCITFPFSIVGSLGFLALPSAFVVFYVLIGIFRIGSEIENPFGFQYNDLPLDKYCKNIEDDLNDCLSLAKKYKQKPQTDQAKQILKSNTQDAKDVKQNNETGTYEAFEAATTNNAGKNGVKDAFVEMNAT